jgi:alanyl-tRNA synthetase
MVRKHYLTDPYRTECEATVTEVRDGRLLLSDTIFFPEGGGQVGDTGTAGGVRILDTQKFGGKPFVRDDFPEMIMVEGEIGHHFSADGSPELPKAGDVVELRLDWDRRYKIMQRHSAAHLAFWYATQARPDLYVKGCRIDDNSARFDFIADERLDPEAVAEWEALSNDAVGADLEISNEPVDNQAEALMWYCSDMRMPCGGTHVRSTGEIGAISLRRKRQGNRLERLYITLQ